MKEYSYIEVDKYRIYIQNQEAFAKLNSEQVEKLISDMKDILVKNDKRVILLTKRTIDKYGKSI